MEEDGQCFRNGDMEKLTSTGYLIRGGGPLTPLNKLQIFATSDYTDQVANWNISTFSFQRLGRLQRWIWGLQTVEWWVLVREWAHLFVTLRRLDILTTYCILYIHEILYMILHDGFKSYLRGDVFVLSSVDNSWHCQYPLTWRTELGEDRSNGLGWKEKLCLLWELPDQQWDCEIISFFSSWYLR